MSSPEKMNRSTYHWNATVFDLAKKVGNDIRTREAGEVKK
jgi:hypothetical protein